MGDRMCDLVKLRKEIDSIDCDLANLFEKRMEIVSKIADYKKQNHLEILNELREKIIIQDKINHLNNEIFKDSVQEFFSSIMKISREYQSQLIQPNYSSSNNNYNMLNKNDQNSEIKLNNKSDCKDLIVGFQGVPGSYSHQALLDYFGNRVKTKHVKEFEDIFTELQNNKINYGVLPIENSSTGGISEVYDLLNKYNFTIIGEVCVKVNHHLLAINGSKIEDIVEVYSHPQAISQCSEFLKSNSHWKLIPYSNTAKSAEFVKNEGKKNIAAIGSKSASKLYGLEILKININSNTTNTTRFAILSKDFMPDNSFDKISVIFSTAHEVGSLYRVLQAFSENNINLLKIESRPIKDKPWEYLFYADFAGNLNDEKVKSAIESVKNNCNYFKLLGNYKAFSL
jgi:chorismate mutase / prephenate dehydratase